MWTFRLILLSTFLLMGSLLIPYNCCSPEPYNCSFGHGQFRYNESLALLVKKWWSNRMEYIVPILITSLLHCIHTKKALFYFIISCFISVLVPLREVVDINIPTNTFCHSNKCRNCVPCEIPCGLDLQWWGSFVLIERFPILGAAAAWPLLFMVSILALFYSIYLIRPNLSHQPKVKFSL